MIERRHDWLVDDGVNFIHERTLMACRSCCHLDLNPLEVVRSLHEEKHSCDNIAHCGEKIEVEAPTKSEDQGRISK